MKNLFFKTFTKNFTIEVNENETFTILDAKKELVRRNEFPSSDSIRIVINGKCPSDETDIMKLFKEDPGIETIHIIPARKYYSRLTTEQRKFISAATQEARNAQRYISTEDYWCSLDQGDQDQLLQQCAEHVNQVALQNQERENNNSCLIN